MNAQLTYYHYWQGATLFLLLVTYIRVLTSGVPLASKDSNSGRKRSKSSSVTSVDAMGQSVFDANGAQIEFMNNTIKIKREDPSQRRDFIILKSWTGVLLGLCSVMCAIFSLVRLLPAIYGSSCHIAGTWNLSRYPGATFALIESLTSLTFLALLLLAAILSVILDYVPRFFLRTVPQSMRKCRRRVRDK